MCFLLQKDPTTTDAELEIQEFIRLALGANLVKECNSCPSDQRLIVRNGNYHKAPLHMYNAQFTCRYS